jgi:ABC-type transport system involved in multi-copper enzyme maturation permease subunit
MSASSASLSPVEFVPGPWRALGGIWRLTYPSFFTLRRLLTLGGVLAVLFLLTTQNIETGQSSEFYRWTTGFYLTFLLPCITFLSAAGAIRDDTASVSVDYVFTRPVRRPVFVILRFLSQMACLQLTSLLALGVLLIVGRMENIAQLGAMLPHLLLAQVLIVAAFSGLGFLLGALTARYLVLGVAYGMLIEVGIGQIPTQISRLSMTHQVLAILQPIAPDVRGLHAPESMAAAAIAVSIFTFVTVGGAALIFAWREFLGSGTAEK